MRILLLFALALLVACQSRPPVPSLPVWQSPAGRQHPDLGRIVALGTGETLTPAQLLTRLADAERVLVGERHDNPDHHALQRWLLQALSDRRAQGSLLLEMLNPDQQARVRAVQAAIAAGEPPADLPAALAWQEGWDWSLYRDLVTHVLQQPYPLLGANLDRDEIMAIYRAPALLAGEASSAPAVRTALAEQIRVSHCDMLPDSQLPAMLAVQQQRDRRMAEALQQAPTPSLLLAGAFHVRRDLGVPLHLTDLGATGDASVLILAEVGQLVTPEQADFVWYTPAQPEVDYCAQFHRRD